MSTLDAVLDRPATATATVTASSRRGRGATFRLLVVDDQPEVVGAIRLLLAGSDIDVTGAATPSDALDLARMHAFDAALVDLNYGKGRTTGQQGLELLRAFEERVPGLPVAVMTGWSSTAITADAARRGARDLIEKPWDETRMAMVLRTLVELGRATRRASHLEGEVRALRTGTPLPDAAAGSNPMRLFDVEGRLVREAMAQHRGNVSRAAKTLGLSRSALYRRLERHRV